ALSKLMMEYAYAEAEFESYQATIISSSVRSAEKSISEMQGLSDESKTLASNMMNDIMSTVDSSEIAQSISNAFSKNLIVEPLQEMTNEVSKLSNAGSDTIDEQIASVEK